MSRPQSEFIWLHRLRESLRLRHLPNQKLVVPPGDDCALVALNQTSCLFAADMLLDGVHFELDKIPPELAGRKAVAVNVSDIAAMAGTPLSITVSLALPQSGGQKIGDAIMDGIMLAAQEFDVSIAGGDTNSWRGPLVIGVSIIGLPHPKGSVLRRGARPGDWLLCTGYLGGSGLGDHPLRRHLNFKPRVAEAQLLQQNFAITSMLDISDGLGSDIRHILKESRVGAIIDPDTLPINQILLPASLPHNQLGTAIGQVTHLLKLSEKERQHLVHHAMNDGEDFELCFTLAPDSAQKLLRQWPQFLERDLASICKIGVITDQENQLLWKSGQPVTDTGYSHKLD